MSEEFIPICPHCHKPLAMIGKYGNLYRVARCMNDECPVSKMDIFYDFLRMELLKSQKEVKPKMKICKKCGESYSELFIECGFNQVNMWWAKECKHVQFIRIGSLTDEALSRVKSR